jgi:hypothetical protein
MPSYRFLRLLLQYYDLEPHNLTSSRILHIATFVTLCKAFMGIDPHFDLWNHFFHVWLAQGTDAEAAVLGAMDIHIKSGYDVDPYFDLPISESVHGRQKMWFFLRNDGTVPLPVFTGNRPIPQPNWGYRVAKNDLRKLQPLSKVVQ